MIENMDAYEAAQQELSDLLLVEAPAEDQLVRIVILQMDIGAFRAQQGIFDQGAA